MASGNPSTRDWIPAECALSSQWRDVVEDPTLDGLIVASPNSTHAEIVIAACERRLPVLVEKPMANSEQEATRILDAARAAPAVVMVNHIHLYNPAFQQLERALAGRGSLRCLRSLAGAWGPFRPDVSCLWDYGPHEVYLTLRLMQADPLRLLYSTRTIVRPSPVAELWHFGWEFSGGRKAHVCVGNALERKTRRLTADLEGSALVFDNQSTAPLTLLERPQHHQEAASPQAIPCSGERPLRLAVGRFLERLRQGDTSLESVELGLRVVRCLEEIEREAVAPTGPSDATRQSPPS